MHLRQAGFAHRFERARKRALVLGREADDHVTRQVELVLERREPAQVGGDGVAASHRAQDTVVAGLERHVQMPADGGRGAQRGDELLVDVVDLDRGEPQPLESRRRPCLAHEARQAVARGAVAVAAEIDPGEHDFTMALLDASLDLGEHGPGVAAARGAAHQRDHAEGAREAAAVLHLDERANAVEPRVCLDAADRADVAGDELGRLLAAARDDDDVLGQPGERGFGEVGAATGDVDAPMGARGARGLLARLRDGLVRDAAGVDDGDVGAVAALGVPVGEEPLAHLVRIDVRDLAAEEAHGERRHSGECYSRSNRSAAQPSSSALSRRRHPAAVGRSRSR